MKISYLDENAPVKDIVEAKLALLTSFSKVKASIIAPKKSEEAKVPTKSGKNFSYYYTTLAAVISAINDATENEDLDFLQEPVIGENNVGVRTYLFNSLGAIMDCGVYGSPSQKKDAQGYGSALTYAKRYSLCAIFGIATEDDDGKNTKNMTLRKSQLEVYTVPYMGTNANLMDLYQEALDGIPEAQDYFKKKKYKVGPDAERNAQAVSQVIGVFAQKAMEHTRQDKTTATQKKTVENNKTPANKPQQPKPKEKPVNTTPREPSPKEAGQQHVSQEIGLLDGI